MDKISILIVEDEIPHQRILAAKFSQADFEIFTADDGEVALEVFNEKQPSIVLVDIVLPRFDGNKLIEEIVKTKYGKSVPIIILTNLDSKQIQQDVAGKKNVHFCLTKSTTKLCDVVEKAEGLLKV